MQQAPPNEGIITSNWYKNDIVTAVRATFCRSSSIAIKNTDGGYELVSRMHNYSAGGNGGELTFNRRWVGGDWLTYYVSKENSYQASDYLRTFN